MKRIKLLTILALGVLASSSGMIQAGAANYIFFVDFSTKEVANFTAYKQTFSTDTYNLEGRINFLYSFTYRFDSCPTAFEVNSNWVTTYRINGTGTTFALTSQELPNLPCTTTNTLVNVNLFTLLPDNIVDTIINDDANFVRFESSIVLRSLPAINGRTMTISNYSNSFDVSYDFNTTYLFNYFLSDQRFITRSTIPGAGGLWTLTATQRINLRYLYTTAGNDTYTLTNSNFTTIGTTRKKYAVDYNMEFFRGQSVGALFDAAYNGSDTLLFGSATAQMIWSYDYYYLNTANLAQAIVDAPIIGFTEEVCGGGFLDINVGCYVNNALAYIVNDAPVISDAFTLLNTGIELAAQTFGVIGAFSDDNVFGYLILVGFGFIAVKWFLKNDE
jgi:hypothetical protein